MSSSPKRETKAHREEIGCGVPTFLWYLFKYYHITAEQKSFTTLAKMKNLLSTIKYQYKVNIEKFATYVIALLLRLTKNGGTDVQDFDKVHEVLIKISCTVFNSEIAVYKQVNASNLDVKKLIIKAREKYRTLVTNKTWTKNVHHKKRNTGMASTNNNLPIFKIMRLPSLN